MKTNLLNKAEVLIALRYLKGQKGSSVKLISRISMIAISVGVAASVVVLSSVNGFRENLKEKVLGKESHVIVIGKGLGIENYKEVSRSLKNLPFVKRVTPFYEGRGLIKSYADRNFGAIIRGIPKFIYTNDKEFRSKFHMVKGLFVIGDNRIVLGETLALNLGVTIGDEVELLVLPAEEDEFSGMFTPKTERFIVSGIFTAGMADYDTSLSFISLKDAQNLFEVGDIAYGLAIRTVDPDKAQEYAEKIDSFIKRKFGKIAYVLSWIDLNRNLFKMFSDQKVMMGVVLFFFFVVIAFNIMSSIMSLVYDRKTDIGILKAVGFSETSIKNIFLINGFVIGLTGAVLGNALGIAVAVTLNDILKAIEFVINSTQNIAFSLVSPFKTVPPPIPFEFIKKSVYYLSQFPIKVELGDLVMLSLFSITTSVLAGVIPAVHASRMRPVEVLRNE